MRQVFHTLTVETRGSGLTEMTRPVREWVHDQALRAGLLTLFCKHTSASLLIQENADPDVRADLEAFFARVAPKAPGLYLHDAEGPDDMPAHIRAALTQSQLSVPVRGGGPGAGNLAGDLSLRTP